MRRNNAVSAAGLAAAIVLLILGSTTLPFAPRLASNETNVARTTSSSVPIGHVILAQALDSPSPAVASNSSTLGTRPVSFLLNEESLSGVTASLATIGVQNHGGSTLHTSITFAIFWLPSSAHYEPTAGGNDSRYESLIIQFLRDVGGNSYYNILNQYPDSTNGTPLDSSVFGGSYIDTTPYPVSGTPSHPLKDSDIQAEVARALKSNGWTQSPNKVFLVFTGYAINSCLNSSFCTSTSPGYCAYHSYFSINFEPTIYGNMPDFGGAGGRCTPLDPSPNNDLYADPEINLVSHELFEAVSDPKLNAWYDTASGKEIGDLCAWMFGSVGSDGSNIILNGHNYLVQQEWSNYDNRCVLSYGPTKLIGITLIPSQGTSPVTLTNPFKITYNSTGTDWWTTTAFTNTTQIYVDQYAQVILSGTSLGSSGLERWCLVESCSNESLSVDNGTTATYFYYDLLAQELSDSIIDGGFPSIYANFTSAPLTPSGVDSPNSTSVGLSNSPETVWVVRGSRLNATSTITGVSGERWFITTANWTINDSSAIPTPITYYHQYLVTFTYQIVGGGTGYSPPLTTFSVLGQSQLATLDENVWADASGYQYSVQLASSSTNQRWLTLSATGTVSSPGIISPSYYHQYSIIMAYSVSGGGNPDPPVLTGVQFGLSVSLTPSLQPSTVWLDAASQFSVTNPLVGSSPSERWQTPTQTAGTIMSTTSFSFAYYHQYYLQIEGGSTGQPGSGWYDSGSQISPILNYVWNMSGKGLVRQNLLSYILDGHLSLVSRQGSGFVALPTINMTGPHSVTVDSAIQYYITTNGATLVGSQTNDEWFDDGSQFTVQASYSATYTATSPLYVYSVNPGFQILSTTPLDSVNWSSSDAKLSFQSDAANVKIYVPSALKISPDYVRSGDISLPYTYSSGTALLSFSGSSNVVVHFVSGQNHPETPPSNIPWLLYAIAASLGVGLISGLVVLGLTGRKEKTPSHRVNIKD